jgi:membrane protein YqaA with SNARE-associated domain
MLTGAALFSLASLASLGGMFTTAFIAATVFPAQSEAVFLALLAAGSVNPFALFIAASLGNTLGAITNWWLGWLIAKGGTSRIPARLMPSAKAMGQGEAVFRRWGWLALFLSWVPIIGDVATIAAGSLGYPLWRFVAVVGAGKAARYAVLWAGFQVFVFW